MAAKKYLSNVNGTPTEVYGTQTSTGVANANQIPALTAAGVLDLSLMPPGIGPDTAVIAASEVIAAGALVNVWSNSGAFAVRNADGSVQGKVAHGFVLAPYSAGASATVYFNGTNNALTGLTPGDQFLSAAAVGGVTPTCPSGAGQTAQKVGVAVNQTTLNFSLEPPIYLS